METLWFFQLRFRGAYDSPYDFDFLFSQDHKRSYDSAYDSDSDAFAGENQPLETRRRLGRVNSRKDFLDCH